MTTSRPITAVLFDLDGTLIDSRSDLADAVNHALVTVGRLPKPESEIAPHIGNGMRSLLSGVLGAVSDEMLERSIEAFVGYYDANCLEKTRLYDGVEEGLSVLNQSRKVGVVTNKPVRFTEKILRGLGIRDCVMSVVGGDTLEQRKPHPAPVLKALTDLGVPPSNALLVGDGRQDIAAGQAAEVRTCLARYGYGAGPDAVNLRPTYTIDVFRELKEIVS